MSKSAAAAGPYSMLALIDEVPTRDHFEVMRDTLDDFAKLTQAWTDRAATDAGPTMTMSEIAVHLRVASRLFNALAHLEDGQTSPATEPPAAEGQEQTTGKKPYSTPILRHLGTVAELTRGTGQTGSEALPLGSRKHGA